MSFTAIYTRFWLQSHELDTHFLALETLPISLGWSLDQSPST